ncbi:hypothetical protein WIS52_23165 [Pseudonocardia nematodicida]|uniref:Uncharacterized protein n=1 Tax=Pseudonocardia nematodicida TaxID=1206997 RepID=A0ABV1KFZ4_9PSEU
MRGARRGRRRDRIPRPARPGFGPGTVPAVTGAGQVLLLGVLAAAGGLEWVGVVVGLVHGAVLLLLLGRAARWAGIVGPGPADPVTVGRAVLGGAVVGFVTDGLFGSFVLFPLFAGLETSALLLDAVDGRGVWPRLRAPLPPSSLARVVAAPQGVAPPAVSADVLPHPMAEGLTTASLTFLLCSSGRGVAVRWAGAAPRGTGGCDLAPAALVYPSAGSPREWAGGRPGSPWGRPAVVAAAGRCRTMTRSDRQSDSRNPEDRHVPGIGGPGATDTGADGRAALRLHMGICVIGGVLSAFVTVLFALVLDAPVPAVLLGLVTLACIAWWFRARQRLHAGDADRSG